MFDIICKKCGKYFCVEDPITSQKICPDCSNKKCQDEIVAARANEQINSDDVPETNEAAEKSEKQTGEPRISKPEYYLNIAKEVCKRGTCLRRNYGAVIVKNDEIISTGYTGAPRGRKNCCELGKCIRNELNVPRGERYELCRSVHAEMNAIISAARRDMIGATLYLYGMDVETSEPVPKPRPCTLCERMIINAGITAVVCYDASIYGHVTKIVKDSFVDKDSSIK